MMTVRAWATSRRCFAVLGLAMLCWAVSATTRIEHTVAVAAAVPVKLVTEHPLDDGDLVRVMVLNNPKLNAAARIDRTGVIAFPLIGPVAVRGMSAKQAAATIAEELKAGGFIANPRVNLVVERTRAPAVSVLGEVKKPGRYEMKKSNDDDVETVADLLLKAGGLTRHAAGYITLIRQGASGPFNYRIDLAALQRGDTTQNFHIDEGDVLFVPRTPVFYIYGDVQRPGAFPLERDMTLMRALAVGGLKQRGMQGGIEIRRRSGDGNVYTARAKLGDPLQPEDVVYVKASL
jgi:polysaccharide export outer membrane protein